MSQLQEVLYVKCRDHIPLCIWIHSSEWTFIGPETNIVGVENLLSFLQLQNSIAKLTCKRVSQINPSIIFRPTSQPVKRLATCDKSHTSIS